MNGKLYCEACHNSTHAEFTSANPADPTIPEQFQGDSYWIWSCSVCHNSEKGSSIHNAGSSTQTSGGDGSTTTSTSSGGDGGTTTNYYTGSDN